MWFFALIIVSLLAWSAGTLACCWWLIKEQLRRNVPRIVALEVVLRLRAIAKSERLKQRLKGRKNAARVSDSRRANTR